MSPSTRRVISGLLSTGLTLGLWTAAHASTHADPTPPAVAPHRAAVPSPTAATPTHRAPAAANPCAHNSRSQLVIVSIERQHEWACSRHRMVQDSAATTGASRRGHATPRGTFAVQGLIRNTTLDGRYHVKYWIPFRLGVWGFHDASWQRIPFGSKAYRTGGSHGCVHLPLPAIRWLFHWVKYGTAVRIS